MVVYDRRTAQLRCRRITTPPPAYYMDTPTTNIMRPSKIYVGRQVVRTATEKSSTFNRRRLRIIMLPLIKTIIRRRITVMRRPANTTEDAKDQRLIDKAIIRKIQTQMVQELRTYSTPTIRTVITP